MAIRDFVSIAINSEMRRRSISYILFFPGQDRRPPTLDEFVVEGDIGECGICLESFNIGDKFTPLPCSETHPHKFHTHCIKPWLRSNNTCPLCRAKV